MRAEETINHELTRNDTNQTHESLVCFVLFRVSSWLSFFCLCLNLVRTNLDVLINRYQFILRSVKGL